MRFMTFNIHHGKGMDGITNLQRIAAEIQRANVDAVGLQEVDCHLPRSSFRNQAAWLMNALNMQAIYCPSMNLKPFQYGNLLLSRTKLANIDIHYLKGIVERRSIITARTIISGKEVTLINTHLGVFKREHKPQMTVLAEVMANIRQPAILMGDFNVEWDEHVFASLMKGWHPMKLLSEHATKKNARRIDHILINRIVPDAVAWVQETISSDHHAVIAQLSWPDVD